MRAFDRLRRVGRRAAIVVAVASALACQTGSDPDSTSPELVASEVAFDALGSASVLVRGETKWLLIDGTARTVTRLAINAEFAALSPDGSEIAYMRAVSSGPTRYGLYVARRDGTGSVRVPRIMHPQRGPVSWSADGKWIYYVVKGEVTITYRVERDGGSEEFLTSYGVVSPFTCPRIQGDQVIAANAAGAIAFTCQSSGVYVSDYGIPLIFGSEYQGSQRVGSPVWSADGTRLAFQVTDSTSSIRIVDAVTGNILASIPVPAVYLGDWMAPDLCWLADQNAFVFVGGERALYTVGADGGEPVMLAARAGLRVTCSG